MRLPLLKNVSVERWNEAALGDRLGVPAPAQGTEGRAPAPFPIFVDEQHAKRNEVIDAFVHGRGRTQRLEGNERRQKRAMVCSQEDEYIWRHCGHAALVCPRFCVIFAVPSLVSHAEL